MPPPCPSLSPFPSPPYGLPLLAGYAVTVGGVFLYSETKRRVKAQQRAASKAGREDASDAEATMPLLGASAASGPSGSYLRPAAGGNSNA